MKGTSVHIKNRWIKQLCNRKVRDFAMAFRARKVSGTFEKRAPDQLFSRATQRLHCFPRLTLVAPFPGLGNGRVLSRAWHRSHDLAWSSNWSDVWLLWLRFYFRTDRCTWRWSGWHWRFISFISFFCVGIVSPQTVHLKQRQDKLWLDFFFDLRVTCMLNNFFTKITFAAFGMAYKAKLNIFRRLFENHSDVTNSFSRKFSHTCDWEFHLPASSEKCPPAIQTFLVISECYAKISDENLTRPNKILSWLMVATDMTFLNSLIFP